MVPVSTDYEKRKIMVVLFRIVTTPIFLLLILKVVNVTWGVCRSFMVFHSFLDRKLPINPISGISRSVCVLGPLDYSHYSVPPSDRFGFKCSTSGFIRCTVFGVIFASREHVGHLRVPDDDLALDSDRNDNCSSSYWT